MAARTALIAGAGVGGLAAAISLRRAGWQVRVHERAEAPRESGFALNLAANATAALRELGVADAAIGAGRVLRRTEIRGRGGCVLKRLDVGSMVTRSPSVAILRSALHTILLDALGHDALVLDSEATGFTSDNSAVTVLLKNGRSEAADVLIGADGVGSAIRRALHGDEAPRASGYFAVRGLAFGATNALGGLDAAGYLAPGVEAGTLRASEDAVYWYMSPLAADVGTVRDPRELAERHAAILDDPFRAILRRTTSGDLRLDELVDRDPFQHWGQGRVTLLGDAAHPMLPHAGQGAAQAVEDAVALGLALADARDPAESLRRYEHVRSRRTRRIVLRGRRIAAVTTTRSPVVGWLRAAAIRAAPAKRIAASFLLADGRDPHRALRAAAAPR